MPTLTRDHTGPYAAPDVDPPWECEPEADAELIAECRSEGEEAGREAYAAGIRNNPYSRHDVYCEARRDGWWAGWDRAEETEFEAAGDTVAEFILPRAA